MIIFKPLGSANFSQKTVFFFGILSKIKNFTGHPGDWLRDKGNTKCFKMSCEIL